MVYVHGLILFSFFGFSPCGRSLVLGNSKRPGLVGVVYGLLFARNIHNDNVRHRSVCLRFRKYLGGSGVPAGARASRKRVL